MDFEKGDTREEKINNVYMLFYFNLMTGDYALSYCESELSKYEDLQDYETCAGILKAINFKKYGNSLGSL
jgi:hypothetical protein|tara:strand:- start:870 stop:1079 length:210 start_codon:yes stop_codon:yes gene_type:complete